MKEKTKKKLETQRRVKSVMERHLSDWQSVSALTALYDRFVQNLKKIEDHLVVTQQDLKSMKAAIPDLKKQLVDRLHSVANAIGVYAAEEGDRKLVKLTDKKRSALKKLKSNDLVKQADKVIGAGKHLSGMDLTAMKKPPRHHISGYGVTDQHLDLLQQAREAYEKAVQEYEKTKASVKRSSGKLAKKIRENDLLLRRKIDRVILLFNEINPDFFRAYMTSRKPAEEKATPADKSAGPAAKKPATAAKKPAASTKKPATAAKKPAASTKKPATAAKKPATAAKKPSSSSGNRSVAAGEKTVKKQPDARNS